MQTITRSFEPAVIPPEDEALREPVRQFLASALEGMPPDRRARSWMGFDADFSRALAKQGWLGLTLPKTLEQEDTQQRLAANVFRAVTLAGHAPAA